MDTIRKYISAISKMNRLTQEGKIEWKQRKAPSNITDGTNHVISRFFYAEHEGKIIGIYEDRYQGWDPDRDIFYWTSDIVLAIFNSNWEKAWEFPSVAGIDELLKSVEYQAANIGDFIEKLIEE